MNTRNVTLAIPEPLLRKFKVHAATQNKSMSSLMTELMEKATETEDRQKAHKRLVALMNSAPLKGLKDGIRWTRDELYER